MGSVLSQRRVMRADVMRAIISCMHVLNGLWSSSMYGVEKK